MRARTRTLIVGGLVALAAAAALWLLVLRAGPGTDDAGRAAGSAASTAPTTTSPTSASTTGTTTTTTAPPGLALPLVPAPTRIAWAGDSVAGSLADAIVTAAGARGIEVVVRTTPGCGMVRGVIADEALAPLEFTRGCDRDIPGHNAATGQTGADVVTWLSTWEPANRIVDGQGYVTGTPEADAKMLELIDESAQLLQAGGARLVLLTVPPATTGPERPTVADADVARTQRLNDLFRRYAAEHADRVALLDLAAIVCPTGPPCPTEVDGVTLRPTDGGHFAGEGPAWLAPRILDRIAGPA